MIFADPDRDDGLEPTWAAMERRYLMALTSHRLGLSRRRMPQQLVDREQRRAKNTRPNNGIARHKASGKWQAYIVLPNGRRRSLGYHPNKAEAERAVATYRARRAILEVAA